MDYWAHIDGQRKQSVKEHLYGTAVLARDFASRFGKGEWGYCCGMLHDIGKYSLAFQDKITNGTNKCVDHSTAGAQVCAQKGGLYPFVSYCIAGHHAGLPDHGSSADSGSAPTLTGRRKKIIEDYSAYKAEIPIPELKEIPFDPRKAVDPDFSLSVFIRMLYSCLVDADFLDTENFMKNGDTRRESGEKLEVLLKKLENHIADWLRNDHTETINGRRSEILRHCLEAGEKERGLFQLTVPTGGGKTIASLAFALCHAVQNQMDRIIFVIPYTSIIEQNAEVFRGILGDENVLENHYNVDYESSEELIPMQLAAENWDKPVVVTTNVQFFESLFSNKSSKCRKLHNIANSVIIFDEAQMLPADYLKPCIAVIEELAAHFRSSIVMCTATQPAIASFFKTKMPILELCPRVQEQFRFFERVTFENKGVLQEEDLIEKLKEEEQALCIVNTKKRAQKIYLEMKGPGVYHLSTTMYPRHRRRILEQIKNRLKNGDNCILISTSLVEAGVDLDFHSVYRQLAGIDSVIQAAGRCNREGKRKAEASIVSLFQLAEKENVPGQQQQIDVAKMLLSEEREISDLDTIERYFEALYYFRGEGLDKKKILDEFKNKEYNFAKAAQKFKLIEENTKTIFISKEAEAEEILRQIQLKGYTKADMRRAGQYCVQVYETEFAKMQGAGMLRPVSGDISDLFVLVSQNEYKEDIGLSLEIESGTALFIG